ncbi:hypothetical protein [Pseudomonas sp. CGJS7]|uniref:hypothetical protein n=1 Tax=Pseudomonas sp. CGJS7 TaxID=3109348 RepID=UPI003009E316
MSRVSFLHMDNHEVAASLRALLEQGEIESIREGFMPEADLFFCHWRGKRFNAKFDLTYGPDLYFLDPCTAEERAELERLIASTEA